MLRLIEQFLFGTLLAIKKKEIWLRYHTLFSSFCVLMTHVTSYTFFFPVVAGHMATSYPKWGEIKFSTREELWILVDNNANFHEFIII